MYINFLPLIATALADELWNALDTVNRALSQTLLRLSDLHARNEKAYTKAVKYLSTLQTVQVRPRLRSHRRPRNSSPAASGSSTPTSQAPTKRSWRPSLRLTNTPRCAPLPPSRIISSVEHARSRTCSRAGHPRENARDGHPLGRPDRAARTDQAARHLCLRRRRHRWRRPRRSVCVSSSSP